MPVPVDLIRVGTVVEGVGEYSGNVYSRRILAIENGDALYETISSQSKGTANADRGILLVESIARWAFRIVPDPAPPDREAKIAALVEAAKAILESSTKLLRTITVPPDRDDVRRDQLRLRAALAALSPTGEAK